VAWIERFCVHTDGLWARRPFLLTTWQREEIVRPLFGWQVWSPQYRMWVRRFSRAQMWLPRGNGKSELAAALELFLLTADGEEGAEVYIAAEDRDQASIVFRVAARMVQFSPVLRKRLEVIQSTRRIIDPRTNSYLRALPRDSMGYGAQGFRVHGAVVDELHVQRRRDLLDALKRGMGKRAQPLLMTITSAGADPNSPEAEDYAYACRVRSGETSDPNLFVYIREAPADADPFDEAAWFDANPALGDFLSLDTLRQEAREAREKPSEMNTFLQFRLNRHVRQVTRFLPMEAWDATAGMVQESEHEGRLAFAGLDVAAEQGLAALQLVIPDDAEQPTYTVVSRYFLPEEDLADREHRDAMPYGTWAREGRLILTPGNVIDYAAIREEVLRVAERFEIVRLAYRRFGALQLALELAEAGLEVEPIASTPGQMNTGTRALLDLVLAGRLRHGGHPVLRWEADALAVKRDGDGNIKPDLSTSATSVPGILALVRALSTALVTREGVSAYEDHGLVIA